MIYMPKPAPTIIPGIRYGHLVTTGVYVPGYMDCGKQKHARLECKCDCGSVTYKELGKLKSGSNKSCGKNCPYTNMTCALKHGLSKDENGKTRKEYNAWKSMQHRCLDNPENPHYKNYFARGIHVCQEFKDVIFFIEYVGKAPTPLHSIDRIDNDKGYEIGNVRWATKKEQQNNRRQQKRRISRLDELKQENDFLKQLLRDNNIEYKAA